MKSTVTLTTLLVILVAGTWIGFRLLTAPFDADTEPAATCEMREFDEGDELTSNQVRVNVLNASDQEGLAYHQIAALGAKNFTQGYRANAGEIDFDVTAVTIMTDDPEHPAVRLVAAQFSDDVEFVEPQPSVPTDSESVTVLLGRQYSGVDEDAATAIDVREPFSWCVAIPPEDDDVPEV